MLERKYQTNQKERKGKEKGKLEVSGGESVILVTELSKFLDYASELGSWMPDNHKDIFLRCVKNNLVGGSYYLISPTECSGVKDLEESSKNEYIPKRSLEDLRGV